MSDEPWKLACAFLLGVLAMVIVVAIAHATVKPMPVADQANVAPCPSVCANTNLPPAPGKVCTPRQVGACISAVTANPTATRTP